MSVSCHMGRTPYRLFAMLKLLGIVSAFLVIPIGIRAATTTSNLSVTIEIQADCEITATTAVDFGTQGVLDANIDAEGSISVQCTSGTGYTVALDAGGGASATTTVRQMTGPASATINYALYQDDLYTDIWGDNVGVNTVAGTGDGTAQVLDVYGRVESQTTPAAGTYTDSVLITVEF